MATTTTNFGWDIPQSTDLVKDGATAIAALGQDIDTALIDLKGGTTGQVLAKASGTDLDFSWVAQDDSNAIQNAIVDAKGDLITATAADTPSRLAVGTNNTVLTADSSTATGLKWASSSGYTSLASGSLTGSAVTLNTISGDYEDLVVVWRDARWTSADDRFRFILNNVATAAYTWLDTRNTSTTVASTIIQYQLSQVYTDALKGGSTDNDAAAVLRIFDYANTSANKQYTLQYMANNDNNSFIRVGFMAGVFDSPSAITRIDLQALANFAGGTYELFGVK
jgi:hypothetical protein